VLRKERPDTKIIVCEPRTRSFSAAASSRRASPDGTPPSRIRASSRIRCRAGRRTSFRSSPATRSASKLIDRLIAIPGGSDPLQQGARAKEGIFVGITSGATFAGALRVAKEAAQGSTILAMLPDTGERYLSTPLFADVPADMNEEELAIARSDAERAVQDLRADRHGMGAHIATPDAP
jgi:cysteine synthase A